MQEKQKNKTCRHACTNAAGIVKWHREANSLPCSTFCLVLALCTDNYHISGLVVCPLHFDAFENIKRRDTSEEEGLLIEFL